MLVLFVVILIWKKYMYAFRMQVGSVVTKPKTKLFNTKIRHRTYVFRCNNNVAFHSYVLENVCRYIVQSRVMPSYLENLLILVYDLWYMVYMWAVDVTTLVQMKLL